MEERNYSISHIMSAQSQMREALGAPEERFSISAVIGMLSDEIEALRVSGVEDEDIATLISVSIGGEVSTNDVRDFYASTAERKRI